MTEKSKAIRGAHSDAAKRARRDLRSRPVAVIRLDGRAPQTGLGGRRGRQRRHAQTVATTKARQKAEHRAAFNANPVARAVHDLGRMAKQITKPLNDLFRDLAKLAPILHRAFKSMSVLSPPRAVPRLAL